MKHNKKLSAALISALMITSVESLAEYDKSRFKYLCVIDSCRVVTPVMAGDLVILKKSFFYKGVKIYEIRVAGKSRKRLIGRVAVAGGTNGQYLPVTLLRLLEKINKFKCRFAERAYAVR